MDEASWALLLSLSGWDMPTGKHYDPAITGKTQKPSMWDYVEVLKDVRVVVMIFQYSACFGFSAAQVASSNMFLEEHAVSEIVHTCCI